VAETTAHSLDGDAGVDEFGGVGVAQLVDVDLDACGGAVGLPAVVGGVVGQRPAAAVDGGAEQRPGGVVGAGQVELEQGDVPAIAGTVDSWPEKGPVARRPVTDRASS
jgi:hypothetical protein